MSKILARRAIEATGERSSSFPKRSSSLRRGNGSARAQKQALRLPDELIIITLNYLRLKDLLNCRRVNRKFNALIQNTLLLQFRVELSHAALHEHWQPLTVLTTRNLVANTATTMERLDALRKQQFGWRNLAWRARRIVSLDHPKGSLYELSNGIFASGKRRKPGVPRTNQLILQQLPRLDELNELPKQAEIDCHIGVSHVCFDIEQDLLVLLEEGGDRGVVRNGKIIWKLHMRSLSSEVIHPAAKVPVIEYQCDSRWTSYNYTSQVMGHNLGILFSSGILGDSDYERLIIWDWVTGAQRGMVFMPGSRYDSFCFISNDTFVIPCARTETINVFLFRPTPPADKPDRGPSIHHLCALKLPTLNPATGYKYLTITCQSQPTPESSVFHSSPIALPRPKKLFVPDQGDGIVQFTATLTKGSRTSDLLVVTHRQALMSFITSSQDALGDPLTEPWESYPMMPAKTWGPDLIFPIWRAISRCILIPSTAATSTTAKWRSQVYGHRIVQLLHTSSPRTGQIRIMDFNPLFVNRPPLFPEDYHPVIQNTVTRRIVAEVGMIPKGDIWLENIESSLPYYEVTTKEVFPLAGVMMDDERIIGLKTGAPGSQDIVALDVFII